MSQVFDVFISYRRSDGKELARGLYTYLSNNGLRVFLDEVKLIKGDYFDTQLKEKLIAAPHYVLIGTTDAFTVRPKEDWVWKEIELAIDEFDKNPQERTLTVLCANNAEFPDSLPGKLDRILKVQRISMHFGVNETIAFRDVLDVTAAVSKLNIWHSAHRWFENSKRPSGRFARLHIDESIMPRAGEMEQRGELPISVSVDNKDGESISLMDAIRNTEGHLFLIGEGGIGKTTAMMKIMENAYADRSDVKEARAAEYDANAPVPIFIELSFAPDNNGAIYESGVSTFIRRSIYKQLSERTISDIGAYSDTKEANRAFIIDSVTAVKPINEIFAANTDSADYLLLLDGLNEVSTAKVSGTNDAVLDLIRAEIKTLLGCPNVRIILTSRTDDVCASYGEVKKLYLSGIDEENIRAFLEKQPGMTREKLEKALSDERLKETLRIPLFLTMYAKLKNRDVCTRGEILRCFFHERRENIEAYTAASRIADLGGNFAHSAGNVDNPWLTAEMQLFILDMILPEIACDMEKNGAFHYSKKKLRELIITVLDGREDGDLLGIYGDDVFRMTNRIGASIAPSRVADEIKRAFSNNINRITSIILDCAVYSLGIMTTVHEEGRIEYGFMHQHIRDYFAAARHISAMQLACVLHADDEAEAAREVMDRLFKEHPVGLEVRRFIGEVLGEHKNKPVFQKGAWQSSVNEADRNRSLLTRVLDIYRGRKRDEAGYGVYSLVHIIDETRGELSGVDFSGIDFTGCSLNGMRLSRQSFPAKFDKALLGYKELAFLGHMSEISSAVFSPDGRRIATASYDGMVKIWDAESFALLGELEASSGGNSVSAAFSSDGTMIVTASTSSIGDDVTIWSADSFTELKRLDEDLGPVNHAAFSPAGNMIITAADIHSVMLWDARSLTLIAKLDGHRGEVNYAAFSPDGRRIVTTSEDGTARIWDARRFTLLGTLDGHNGSVYSASFSPDGNRVIVNSGEQVAYLWNAVDFSLIGKLGDESHKVISASFSPNGKRIVAASGSDISVWDANSLDQIARFKAAEDTVHFVEYSRDGKTLLMHTDSTVSLWNAERFSPIGKRMLKQVGLTVFEHKERARVSFSLQSSRFIVQNSSSVVVFDIKDGIGYSLIGSIDDLGSAAAALSPDGREIAVRSSSGKLTIWDTQRLHPARSSIFSLQAVVFIAFTPDGKTIVTVSDSGDVTLWDAQRLIETGGFRIGSGSLLSTVIEPGGKLISSENDIMKVWDLKTRSFKSCPKGVTHAAFSPDGKQIAIKVYPGKLMILEADSFRPTKAEDVPFSSDIGFLLYSPDGRFVVVFGGLGMIDIFDAETLTNVGTISINMFRSIDSAAFSPDGSLLIVSTNDGFVSLFSTDTYELIDEMHVASMPDLVDVDLSRLANPVPFTLLQKKRLRRSGAMI